MQNISLKLQERTVTGKAVKALRREGQVPAVIHDHGKNSVIVMAPYLDMMKAYEEAGKHHPLNLQVGNQKLMALIKEADFDPKKHKLRHVVFNAIKQNETVEAEIPVQLVGEIPAEKVSLIVLKQLDHVLVEALPKDLIDVLEVSAESLVEIGDRLTVADIKAPEGVTIKTEPEHIIAVVEEPRTHEVEEVPAEEGEAEEAAEGAETAEGGGEEAAVAGAGEKTE